MSFEALKDASRKALLLAQYDTSYEALWDRLQGLTDAEYFWEPVPGCWSIRAEGEIATPHALGGGPWRLDHDRQPPEPAPITTIAWRIGHLLAGQRMRYDYTFGSRALRPADLRFPGSADEALAHLADSHKSWRDSIARLTEAELDQVGLSAYPWGLDPELPFAAIMWWTNRELIHHGAEIALLRDLWQAQPR